MQYVEVDAARGMPGVRLVLTKGGSPAPWSEAAKKIFEYKEIPFTPVPQRPGKANEALVAWTGLRNAPIAVCEDLPPRSNWADILMLAERLAPERPLMPEASADRVAVLGMSAEICGEGGFGWSRRLMMLGDYDGVDEGRSAVMRRAYGESDARRAAAPRRCVDILAMLAERLRAQKARGSPFFVGEAFTACDLYWACFSPMLSPPPPETGAIHPAMVEVYANIGPLIAGSYDPILLEHRDMIFRDFIGLPGGL